MVEEKDLTRAEKREVGLRKCLLESKKRRRRQIWPAAHSCDNRVPPTDPDAQLRPVAIEILGICQLKKCHDLEYKQHVWSGTR